MAVNGDHMEVLQYLHENGCPWDSDACHIAAGNCNLEILKYLHDNGCPWDEWTLSIANDKGHHPSHRYVIEYLIANGCPRHDRGWTVIWNSNNNNLIEARSRMDGNME
jgi:tRNA(Ile)-lysidine synthase TilS/MesJ